MILVLGDSLSAEYGLKRGSGWVALLEQRLARQKIAAKVVNASISGDTTSGGRSRLPALLQQARPTHVIIELGGNDALRGLPLPALRDNLTAMIELAQKHKTRVLLLGIELPVNYGPQYRDGLRAIYADLARERKVALLPFLLEGVALDPDLMQADGLHPVAAAEPRVLENVWKVLQPLLRAPNAH